MKLLFPIAFLFQFIGSYAQPDSSHPLSVSGYVEAYYSYDFGKPANHQKPAFLYSYNRHNEVNINLAFLKANYTQQNVRANLAIGAGTYMNANLAAEPGVLKNVFEANVGVKLARKEEIWLDAGILPSHIGFESAIGKDCWTLTRSILAENSPYYEAGLRLSYTSENQQWFISALVLNGWQRIQRVGGNNTPAFGHQITYKPNDKITLNSSSFVGSDKPDSSRQWRILHNFFGTFQFNHWADLTIGFDYGWEQQSKNSSRYNKWYSPVLILRTHLTERDLLAMRAEYYHDPANVIVSTNAGNGFRTNSYSINYDHVFSKALLARLEARRFQSRDQIFLSGNQPTDRLFLITGSLAFSF